MKKVIRLTENDLHRIIKESANKILREMNYDYGEIPSFVIRSISVNGSDVSDEFFNEFGNEFENKYDFSSNLNDFLERYGIRAYDVDTASDFGESGDGVFINTNSKDSVEVHGGYEDLI